jgi:hypothetical protein
MLEHPTAAGPSVLGDWDADGDVDAVTIVGGSTYLATNDGAGAFLQSLSNFGTHAVAVADLNLDGGLESVTAIDSSSDAIHSSLGPISTSVSAPRSVAVSDLDGDGDVDVASASAGDDKIAWYPNTATGSFGSQQVVSTAADGASAVFAADLDGDGDGDLLSTSSTDGKVAWYENADGLGGFGSQQVLHASAGAVAVHAADLDGDGDLDVLAGWEVGTSSSTTSWFEQLNVADPTDPDTDGDLMLDGFEVDAGLDPYDPADAAGDADSDGLDNLSEQAAGTDPLDPDTDGDGFSDGDEILAGTDPLDDQSSPPPAVPALTPWGTLLLIALLAAIPARRGVSIRRIWT